MATLVLAAGLGTRLRPLTDELPKPLVPVGDQPALFHVLDRVAPLGPVVVNAHHHQDTLAAALLAYRAVPVAVSREERLLGTAGGLRHAGSLLGSGDVLVWNGDILVSLDPVALLAAHAGGDGGPVEATLAVAFAARGEGNVGVDGEGRVVRLRRESFGSTPEERGGFFLGIHVVGAGLRGHLPASGCLVGDVYLPAGHAGARFRAFAAPERFVDIGSLASYFEANVSWLRERRLRFKVDAEVPAGVSVGDDVVVPASARIEGRGSIERVVAWPGARVEAPLRSAIVTRERVVPLPEEAAP